MGRKEVHFLLGGPQGAGLDTTSQILTSALSHLRYGVISDREYFSNIRGRHSYIHTTVSAVKIPSSLTYPVDIVAGIDAESIFTHFEDLDKGGYLVYDSNSENVSFMAIPSMEKDLKMRLRKKFQELGIGDKVRDLVNYLGEEKKINLVPLDFNEILGVLRDKFGVPPATAKRYTSTIIVGAVGALMDVDLEGLFYGLEWRFGGRKTIIEHNEALLKHVYDIVKGKHGAPFKLDKPKLDEEEFLIVTGNDITAMGKIVAGLRIQTYYPITPAADESTYIEDRELLEADGETLGGIVVFQTEDELAAIASAIGASLTGARAATATSGPGFSLMTEALGWAGINEVPVVITYYQRGGPSTGLPTRGSQSDLLFTIFASHGEFPRIVMASGDHLEAFYDAIDAFNYAERYQLPVIHLLDKFLANSYVNLPIPEISNVVKIDRGRIYKGEANGYKRFDLSQIISRRAFLGSKNVMWYTGDEHNEFGHIDEDPENRTRMYEKRMRKLEIADKEIPIEKRVKLFGDEDSEYLLVGWGFTKGVALDAIESLRKEGIRASYLHIRMFIPFPSNFVKKVIERFDPEKVIAVEHSYTAQVAKVITMNTGFLIKKFALKWTGRPIYRNELIEAVKKIASGENKVVMKYGA